MSEQTVRMTHDAPPVQAATVEGFELRGHSTPVRALVRDIWVRRRLIRLLARRDFHVRYRRPSFGLLWVVAVPVVQAAVLSVVFSLVVRVPTPVPAPVFMLSGILPWLYFSSSITAAVSSITGGGGLAKKVYFPRALLPLIVVRSNLYGFGFRIAIVLIAAVVFGVGLGPSLVLLVPATILMIVLTSAFALVLAALHVYFRDMAFIVQVVTQAWFYASGVFFPIEMVPKGVLRTAVELNPAAGMVDLFRSAVIDTPVGWDLTWPVLAWSAALFVAAAMLYRRFDRVFIDLL